MTVKTMVETTFSAMPVNGRAWGDDRCAGWATAICAVPTPFDEPGSGEAAWAGRSAPLPTLLPRLNRRPHAFRCRRHVDMRDAIGAVQRVDDRVHDRRAGADRPGLAGPLDAEGIGLRRDRGGL